MSLFKDLKQSLATAEKEKDGLKVYYIKEAIKAYIYGNKSNHKTR